MRRLTVVLMLAMALVLVAAACGGGDDDDDPVTPTTPPVATSVPLTAPAPVTPEPAPSMSTVNVELTEFAIDLDNVMGATGDITFVTTNSGALPHQFVVLQTNLAPDALPIDTSSGKADEDAADAVSGRIEEADLPAGASVSVTFNLAPGNYILICNIAGHYQSGMTTAFTVE